MQSTLTQLLDTPPGFQRFAWHGLPLLLPEDWNLQAHRGEALEGALFFVDLRTTRLELRWRTPAGLLPGLAGEAAARLLGWRKNPQKTLDRQLRKIQKNNHATLTPTRGGTLVETRDTQPRQNPGTSFLTITMGKIVELFWPALPDGSPSASPKQIDKIIDDFQHWAPLLEKLQDKNTTPPDATPSTFWSVYGAAGFVPTRMKTHNLSMMPGNTRLEFTRGKKRLTLAACSMAERLLAHDTLETWASKALDVLKKNGGGTWKQSGDTWLCTVFLKRAVPTLPPREIHFRFQHQPAANRIVWQEEELRSNNLDVYTLTCVE